MTRSSPSPTPVRRSEGWLASAVVALVCASAGLLVMLDSSSGLRPPLVFVALVAGPGWVCCGPLRIADRRLAWSLAIAVGIAVNMLLALSSMTLNVWRPVGASLVLLFGSAQVLTMRVALMLDRMTGGRR